MSIKEWLQQRSLRRHRSGVPTGIMPLDKVRTAVILIDVEDPSFDECKLAIQNFYRDTGIKGDIFFLDLRKLIESERLITSITNTVLRKDIDFLGRPSKQVTDQLNSFEADMFISLVDRDDFTLEYLCACCNAKFKIGRRELRGSIFDIVFRAEDGASQLDVFNSMKPWLQKIS